MGRALWRMALLRELQTHIRTLTPCRRNAAYSFPACSYDTIDLNAPFAVAFDQVGLGWAQRVVAAGALTGIVTSLLGSLLGQARIYVTLGRQALAPAWLVGAGVRVLDSGV